MKKSAHIMLGYTCNSHCNHCVVQTKRHKLENQKYGIDLEKNEIINRIDNEISSGANEIVLTGGEPTLRKDIYEIVNYIWDKKINLQIQTNGSMPEAIKSIVDMVKDNKSTHVSFMIPLHAHYAELHNNISHHKDSFENAVESIKYIKSNNLELIGKVVYTKCNDDLKKTLDYFVKLGADKIIIAYPHCVKFPDELVFKVLPDLLTAREALKFLVNYQYKNKIVLQGFPLCVVHEMIENVQECDKAYLNEEHMEIKYDNPKHLWNDYRLLDKVKFSSCTRCKYEKMCEGIWKEYVQAYDSVIDEEIIKNVVI